MTPDRLSIAPEVAAALADGAPVVALESTLISHGLPYPQNIEVASASEAAVRESGAIPATVAIRDGRMLVGLDEAALHALATAPKGTVRKAARPSLAIALAEGGWAAVCTEYCSISPRVQSAPSISSINSPSSSCRPSRVPSKPRSISARNVRGSAARLSRVRPLVTTVLGIAG
mgnify:CR=1 FL=1